MPEESTKRQIQELSTDQYNLPNFQKVSPTLYRGGQPSAEGFKQLMTCGIRTVINLRDERSLVSNESNLLQTLGLKYVSIPLSPFVAPGESDVLAFLECVCKTMDQPHFVHCLHGQDRTGTLVSIYRQHLLDWSVDRAYAEALQHGFHSHFSNLQQTIFSYVKKK